MIPSEILAHVRRIHITTRRLVSDGLAGQYHSAFKGRGMEFDEVREYQPGDDIRSIDWNVTARTGQAHIKKFVEERELTVMLIFDASRSGIFGSDQKNKREIAAELGAVLAFSAIENNDKVGLIIFTDQIEKYIPPKKGKKHVLRVIREILYFEAHHYGTRIEESLRFLGQVIKRKSVCFLISDFLDQGYAKQLEIANKRHDIIAIAIRDRREEELPAIGLMELQDAETAQRVVVDTFDPEVRRQFKAHSQKLIEKRSRMFRSHRIDFIDIISCESYLQPLIKFFHMREKRR